MSFHEYLLVINLEFLIHYNKESDIILCFASNKGEVQTTKTRSCICDVKRYEGDIVH